MSGLRNLKIVLLVVLGGPITHCGIVAAGELLQTTIRLESRVPRHVDSMWNPKLHKETEDSGFLIEASSGARSGQVNVGNIAPLEKPEWSTEASLLEMSLHDAISACDSGEINLLPLNRILPDGTTLADYIWNGVQPCAIGHSVWATYSVFDTTRYINGPAPILLQDFFNTEAFPGKRAMKKSPRAIVEWVLLTSGISRQDIYPALSSVEIWPLIEKSLELLAPEIIWVDSDREALEMLDNGTASFALVSSYNLVRTIAENKNRQRSVDHYGIIWNSAVAHMSLLAIPKNSATDGVIEFLRTITAPIRNLQLSTALGYAPVGRGQTALINNDYRRALPVDGQTTDLFWGNEKWWREQGGEIEALFRSFAERTFRLETAHKNESVLDG